MQFVVASAISHLQITQTHQPTNGQLVVIMVIVILILRSAGIVVVSWRRVRR